MIRIRRLYAYPGSDGTTASLLLLVIGTVQGGAQSLGAVTLTDGSLSGDYQLSVDVVDAGTGGYFAKAAPVPPELLFFTDNYFSLSTALR